MADFSVHAFFLYFCLYLSSYIQFLPHLLTQHSHYSGKFLLHLGPFYPPIYPHGHPEPTITSTIFPGGLQANFNERISVAPAYVWDGLFLVYAINVLQDTLNERISSATASLTLMFTTTVE